MREELKKGTSWFIVLGVVTFILGVIALLYSAITTLVTAVFFGILLVLGGISEEIFSTRYIHEKAGRFLLHLVLGLFTIVVGAISIAYPVIAAESLTILLGAFFTVTGLFMFIGAPQTYAPRRGWMMLNGVISFILGILILIGWPITGLWVIGLFVGIHLIFRGVDMTALGLMVRKAAA